MALNLDGLIPATVLPMTADGGIDQGGRDSGVGEVAQMDRRRCGQRDDECGEGERRHWVIW